MWVTEIIAMILAAFVLGAGSMFILLMNRLERKTRQWRVERQVLVNGLEQGIFRKNLPDLLLKAEKAGRDSLKLPLPDHWVPSDTDSSPLR